MSNEILACRINNEEIYFIKRPTSDTHDGFIKRDSKKIPIPFWSYVSRAQNVEPIRSSKYLREMWDGNFRSKEWIAEYMLHNKTTN